MTTTYPRLYPDSTIRAHLQKTYRASKVATQAQRRPGGDRDQWLVYACRNPHSASPRCCWFKVGYTAQIEADIEDYRDWQARLAHTEIVAKS